MEYTFSKRMSGLRGSAIREIFKYAADPAVIRQKFVSAVQKTLGDEGAEKAADLLLAADSLSGVSPIAQLISVA